MPVDNKVQGRSSLLTTLDGRRVARCTHTSVDRNALAALLRSRMGLLWTLFLHLCSSWQDFVWYSFSCSLPAVEELLGYSWYRGNVQTPGPFFFGCNQSQSFYVISVLPKCFLGCVFQNFCNPFLGKSKWFSCSPCSISMPVVAYSV